MLITEEVNQIRETAVQTLNQNFCVLVVNIQHDTMFVDTVYFNTDMYNFSVDVIRAKKETLNVRVWHNGKV